jgi:hypothetical protein
MSDALLQSSKRVLDPAERIAEVLFGLIMVLTFTGSLSVAEAGRGDVQVMLIGALGCNFAWGIIDAVLYLMSCLADKGRNLQVYRAARAAKNPQAARTLMQLVMPSVLSKLIEPAEWETLHRRVQQLPEPPAQARLSGADWRGAFGVFVIVFLSTLPVALPFVFLANAAQALRVSNGIAVVMLFLTGVAYSRCVGRSPWVFGLAMVILGGLLVALTIHFGG